MTRRTSAPLPGIRAWFDGACDRCDAPIVRGVSRIYAKRGVWRHVECANGGGDE